MTTEIVKVTADSPSVVELAGKLDMEPKDVAATINQQAYRKAYNANPGVKEKRREYTRIRNANLAKVARAMKENPELLEGLDLE